MDYIEFIKQTVLKFDDVFEDFKDVINEEFRLAKIIDSKTFSQQVFCEKLCDYFEMVAIKAYEEEILNVIIKNYMKQLEKLVKPGIKSSNKKQKSTRAKTYFDKANKYKSRINKEIKGKDDSEITSFLVAYTRIMICLYSSIIKNGNDEIDNFNLSVSSIDNSEVISHFKNSNSKKIKLSTWREHYSIDRAVFLLLIIIFYKIINDQVKGEFFDA